MSSLPPSAVKPAVEAKFFDDPLFENPEFFDFYDRLHGVAKEIYDIIYHDCYSGLCARQLKSVYQDAEFTALLYSVFRRTYLPHVAKGLEGAEITVFMRDVASSEEIYFRPVPLRYRPVPRVYTFGNIVQLDVTIGHASDYILVQPIQYMLLADLTFRYPPDTGKHIIPLLNSWNPATSGLRTLRKLRLIASSSAYHGYDHKPMDIYWDHPDFARALHLFPSLTILAFVHPAYVVPIKDPVWGNDDEEAESDDGLGEDVEQGDDDGREDDFEEGMDVDNDEGMEADDYEGVDCNDDEKNSNAGVEEIVNNDSDASHDHASHGDDHADDEDQNNPPEVEKAVVQDLDQDERLFRARQALRIEQEARYGFRRRNFYLEEADWKTGEQSLVMEWASPSLSTIFLVYAHDEGSQVRGDFSLEQDVINGCFSHWTRASLGHWTRRENEYYTRRRENGGYRLSQHAADLKLSGMQFAEDCWSYSNGGTVILSKAQYRNLYNPTAQQDLSSVFP